MVTHVRLDRPAWRPWTVLLPAALATAVCLFLGTFGWLAGAAIGAAGCSQDGGLLPPSCGGSGERWLTAGCLGQWVLAVAVVTLAVRCRSRPALRPGGAIACWLAIPLAAGWYALCFSHM